jgi:hypothetical protein
MRETTGGHARLLKSQGGMEGLIAADNEPAFCSTLSDVLEPETEAALQMAAKQLCARRITLLNHAHAAGRRTNLGAVCIENTCGSL